MGRMMITEDRKNQITGGLAVSLSLIAGVWLALALIIGSAVIIQHLADWA